MTKTLEIYKRALKRAEKKYNRLLAEGKLAIYGNILAAELGMVPNTYHEYSIKDLTEFEFMPVCHNRSIKNLITKRVLKARVFGNGKNTRYLIKVSSILTYLDNLLLES